MADPTCLFCDHRLDGRSKKFCTTCLPPYGEWQDKREYQRRYQILWCAIGHGTTGMEKCRIPKGHPARVERRSMWRPKPSPPRPCDTCGEPASGPKAKWCNGCRRIAMFSVRQANGLKVQARIRSERPADWKPVESWRRRQRMAQRAAAKRRSGTRPTIAKLAARDGWSCHLCKKPIDPDLTGTPSKYKASIDHLVPLSDDGEDEMWNTKLAHLRCNAARCNRGTVQLLLPV